MSNENAPARDPDRDMRVIGNAVRNAEKLKELEAEQSKRDQSTARGRLVLSPEEEDRLRRRVVEHILKLRERKRSEGDRR